MLGAFIVLLRSNCLLDSKKWFPPLRPNKTMVNQLKKNRIICRIMDVFCRIISLENAEKTSPFLPQPIRSPDYITVSHFIILLN